MIRKKSIVTVTGYSKSYVDISELNLATGGSSDNPSDNPVVPDEPGPKYKSVSTKSLINTLTLPDDAVFEPGYVIPNTGIIGSDNNSFLNNITDIELQVLFDPGTGKLYTVEKDSSGVTATYTVLTVDDPDTEDIYYLQDFDAYYHFVDFGDKYEPVLLYYGTSYLRAAADERGSCEIVLSPNYYTVCDAVDALHFTLVNNSALFTDGFMRHAPIMGRFTANSTGVNVTLPAGIQASSKNPEFEEDHLYEYSLMDGIFSCYDVTPVVE